MKGVLVGKFFLGSVVWYVTNQLNTIIAKMVNVMLFFMKIPFGVKYELLHPKGILVSAS